MNRAEFLAALRTGLSGMPASAIADITSDYEAHFADGIAAGRSEADIAAALGEPDRLARELRVEAGLQRWEARRTPGNAAAAVFALIGLGALDIIVLLPLLLAFAATMIGLMLACTGVAFGGVATMFAAPFDAAAGRPFAAILAGLGLTASAIAGGAILIMIAIAAVNAVVWFARLHYRTLKRAGQA